VFSNKTLNQGDNDVDKKVYTEEQLQAMTPAVLKKMCKEYEVRASKKKAEMVGRLLEIVGPSIIKLSRFDFVCVLFVLENNYK
jgi:hypothetical protein